MKKYTLPYIFMFMVFSMTQPWSMDRLFGLDRSNPNDQKRLESKYETLIITETLLDDTKTPPEKKLTKKKIKERKVNWWNLGLICCIP